MFRSRGELTFLTKAPGKLVQREEDVDEPRDGNGMAVLGSFLNIHHFYICDEMC